MEKYNFSDAKRELKGVTSSVERKILLWFAARIPLFINSDHLSVLGLVALLGAGICYWLSVNNPSLYLHLVNLMLFLNWFGDSLDGSLARYRNKLRPRYGFYVDHIIDTFGVFFLLGGLAVSGYMSERISFSLLIVYYMLSINSYLSAYTIGKFKISYGLLGPTELRVLLAIGNVVIIYHPHAIVLEKKYLLYDVGGVIAVIGMIITLIISVIKNTYILYNEERI